MGLIKPPIEITPGVCNGTPRIGGHRIRVQDLVIMHDRMGKNPYEIVKGYSWIILCLCRLEDEMRAKTPSLLMHKLKERSPKDASDD